MKRNLFIITFFDVSLSSVVRLSLVMLISIVIYVCLLYFLTVTCMIMQKNGAGLHTASSCYWNNDTDGSCTVRWENKSMYCICR